MNTKNTLRYGLHILRYFVVKHYDNISCFWDKNKKALDKIERHGF